MATVPVGNTVFVFKTDEDSKDRILFTIQIAVKQIQHYFSLQSSERQLSIDVHEVKQLCDSLDKVLFHGLKGFDKGYWSFVKEFTHKNTVKFLQEMDNVQTQLQCGRAWLCLALNESSLESYFRSFLQNVKYIKKHYEIPALLCDEQRMQLVLMLMAGLEFVPINIELEKISFGNGLSFFENQPPLNPLIYNSKIQDSPSKVSKDVHLSNYELVHFDRAVEVTTDFRDFADLNSPEHVRETNIMSNNLHKSSSSLNNCSMDKTVTVEDLEKISHYINIDTERDTKSIEDLEVIRTKVVRRTKRSSSQIHCQNDKNTNKDSRAQSVNDVTSTQENRLSKTTTDSGLCLETPYSSDSELTDATDDIGASDEGARSFDVSNFCQDISVTFSVPQLEGQSPSNSRPKIEERGVPEGQEDPVEITSLCNVGASRLPLQSGNDGLDIKSEELDEELSIYDLCKISAIEERCDKTMKKNDFVADNPLSCDISSTCSESSSKSIIVDAVSEELAKLALEKPQDLDLKVGNNILLYFLVEVYEHEEENFYKLYCGYSNFSKGSSQKVYFLLSNKSTYFLKPGNNEQKFFKLGGLRYSSIDYIMVDLNYQSFKLISQNRDSYPLYTGDEELTREILSNLEIGIRRFIPKLLLPTVFTDATTQLIIIKKFLATVINCERSSVILDHYVLARWEDYTTSSVTPTGPIYQDYLMYRHVFAKENKATAWQPGYFVLKGGVLHCMENEKSKPLFFIQMCAPHCKGCRRIHLRRPHTFEILHSNSNSLQLAAADNYEASKWLQCFLETVSLAGHFIDTETSLPEPCCVMIANNMVAISREEPRKGTYRLLNKANISDLVTIFVDPVASNFVMLEFELAEASKSSGEWIICFESLMEKEKFIDILSVKWFQIFQVKISVKNFKDIYLLKKYRSVSEEIRAEKNDFQNFCADN